MTRDEVIKGLERCMGKVTCTGCPLECMEDDVCALTLLQEAVALLKAEPKRGRWIDYPECLAYDGAYSEDHIVCSCCHHVWDILDNETDTFTFCPNCGAMMVEVDA